MSYSSFKKGTKFVHFSTGGWSENEDLVSELEKERVWHHFLTEWKSGGHYKFIIPPNSLLNYDFKKECLDKQREFHLTQEEFSELFCKGKVITSHGLRLNTSVPADYGKFKRMIPEQRVREALEKYLTEKHCGTAWANTWRKELLERLGL